MNESEGITRFLSALKGRHSTAQGEALGAKVVNLDKP